MGSLSKYYQQDISNLTKVLIPKGVRVATISHKNVNASQKRISHKPDYVIFDNALSYVDDIQILIGQLKAKLSPESRVVIISFNHLWKPLLDLATTLGLRERIDKEPNWLTTQDIKNIFYLEGFEEITKRHRLIFPIDFGPISTFFNKFFAQLPIINQFCLTNYQVFRLSGEKKEYSTSIIIPARNEAGNMKGVLAKIPKLGKKTEVIFIEGHSKDNTFEILKQEVKNHKNGKAKHLSDVSLHKQRGTGKGDAVRLGFKKAKNEILIILDADLTVDPSNLHKFYDAIAQGKAEFVNGSRLIYPMEKDAMRFLNYLGNKFFSLTFTYLLDQPIKDTLCGTKALRKSDYDKIAKNRKFFGDFDPFGDFDLLFGATKLNLKIAEVPIRYKERVYGTTNINRFVHFWLLLTMTFFAAKKLKFT